MRHAAKKTNGFETGKDEQRQKLRAAIAKRVSGDAALSRRRKLRFEGGLPRHPARFAPLRLLFPKSSPILFGRTVDLFCYSFWRALGFGARAQSARVTVRRQPHRQRSRRLVYKPSARITAILEKNHKFYKKYRENIL